MSIPPDSPWRGAASYFRQPVGESDLLAAQFLVETIYCYNGANIEYRSSDGEIDILRHVFRWDRAGYTFVFENGFEARRQEGTRDETYFNLERYVNSGGRPLDTTRETTHAFVSTTLSSSWFPTVNPGQVDDIFRYEIYAPGGIWVAQTLEDRYRYPAQDEVAFIAGIAPQYIRSAQRFQLTGGDRPQRTRRRRVNTTLYINRNFNPQSHPQRTLRIQRPVRDYIDDNGQRRQLVIQEYPEYPDRRKRAALAASDDIVHYYTEGVANEDSYIDSAFRSCVKNEAYIFIKKEYVLMNYAPGSTGDRVINNKYICNGFPSLAGTAFAEYGIDAAFGVANVDESFVFSGKLCAKIKYAPGTTDDRIIEGPKTIEQMFPFFKGTRFEKGVDAAFESTKTNEAYLFKGAEYALINFATRELIAIRSITDGFDCLRNTMFASDIGAAFASHNSNEAYLFKDNNYILLHFTPGEKQDYIIDGPKEIVPSNWPSLKDILPRKNGGLDVYESDRPNPERDQDD